MEIKNKNKLSSFTLILVGFLFVSHSLFEILNLSIYPGKIFIPLIVVVFIINSAIKSKIITLYKKEGILFFFFTILILYSFLTSLFSDFSSLFKSIDLSIIITFYFIGRYLSFQNFRPFFIILITFSIIHSFLILIDYQAYYINREINYLLLTISISYGAIISLIKVFNKNLTLRLRLLYAVFYTVTLYAISITHSRTNFILLAALGLLFIIKKSFTFKRLPLIFVTISLFIYFLNDISYFTANLKVVDRIMALAINSDTRFTIYNILFNSLDEFILTGFGTGGTEVFLMSKLNQPYPHNLFVELITEFGLIGLGFSMYLIFFIVSVLVNIKWENIQVKIFALIFIFTLIIYMKSFSLYNAYPFFFLLGLLFSNSKYRFSKIHV